MKTKLMGFPCRSIIQCALAYVDYIVLDSELRTVLDDYKEVQSFFNLHRKFIPEALQTFSEKRKRCGVVNKEQLQKDIEKDVHDMKKVVEVDLLLSRRHRN